MKKLLFFVFLSIIVIIFWTKNVFAQQNAGKLSLLNLPPEASTQNIVSLGQAKDPVSGKTVKGFAIIHRKKSNVQNSKNKINNKTIANTIIPAGVQTSCYGYLALGAKWKTIEPWILNPSNTRGLNSTYLLNQQTLDIAKWENAADGLIDNNISNDIIGNGTITNQQLPATLNGQNEVLFANVNTPGAVAITSIWGFFNSPIEDREIVEWDQVYNDAVYDWSSNGEPNKFDFENTSTHELGHVMGLSDQYDPICNLVSMYGFTFAGDIEKRNLKTQDITGISQLYDPKIMDIDQDGFTNLVENYISTNPYLACGPDAYPPDFDNNGITNSTDLNLMAAHYGYQGINPQYSARYDLNANGVINSADLLIESLHFGSCTL